MLLVDAKNSAVAVWHYVLVAKLSKTGNMVSKSQVS